MSTKKLLIVNQSQFGYNNATYYYCKHLCDSFDITYICWDYCHKKMELKGIDVIYIPRNGNVYVRNLRFIYNVLKELQKNYDFHILKYFKGCLFLKILNHRKKFLLDIRTGSINRNIIYRFVHDLSIKIEAKFFRHISVISNSLAQKLNLDKKAYILPLGADIISDTNKKFDSIDLLYVGTLSNRNIEQTINGFSKFYHEYNDRVGISYTIIGSGFRNEINEMEKVVAAEKLTGAVTFTGQLPHDKLKPYFDKCNIGVSFIPKTDYFDVQPPTKTFEYFLSGMPVIATDTKENAFVVNKQNGILIDDNPDSFYKGLIEIFDNKSHYMSETIRKTSLKYTWKTIVADLKVHIETINRA